MNQWLVSYASRDFKEITESMVSVIEILEETSESMVSVVCTKILNQWLVMYVLELSG